MLRPLASSLLALSMLSMIGCSDPEATCEPACRDGFACVRGACVSACNPACAAGERCTSDARCVSADLDANEGASDARTTSDVSSSDDTSSSSLDDAFSTVDAFGASSDDARGIDAYSSDAAIADCGFGSVLCSGSCVTPIAPELGVRTPTTGRYGMDYFDAGDLAIDPCTGTLGLAYAQQVMGSENDEVFFLILGPSLSATPIGPLRVTTAPGAAQSVSITWANDRFFVFWSDPRHDAAPESCTRCDGALYVAAFGRDGTQVLAETRLTTTPDIELGGIVATAHPSSGEVMVVWSQSDTRQLHAGIVAPDGTMRAEQVVSATTAPQYGSTPHVVWNDGWTIFYRHDDPDGARPDYFHVRSLAGDGTLGPDLDLGVYGEQIALTSRGASGHATITTGGGSSLALRLWDASWTATTTLPITSGTFDGTRGLAFDGTSLFHTDGQLALSVVRRNGLGTETGRFVLTSDRDESLASELELTSMGGRLVVFWLHPDVAAGSIIHHRIQVLDAASVM